MRKVLVILQNAFGEAIIDQSLHVGVNFPSVRIR